MWRFATLGQGRDVQVQLPTRYALDTGLRGALKSAQGVVFREGV